MSQDSHNSSTERLLQLVRAYRGESSQTSPETRSLLRDELSRAIEGAVADPTAKLPPQLSETNLEVDVELVAAGPTSEQIQLRIRKMIQAGATWGQIEKSAWQLLRMESSAATAGQILEMAVLYGGLNDIDRILSVLLKAESRFYETVHDKIRSAVFVKLWEVKAFELMRRLSGELVDESQLNEVERLFRFWEMTRAENLFDAFGYYQQHFETIERALNAFGPLIGVSRDQLYLILVKSAIQLRQDQLAKRFMEQISPSSNEFARALDISGFMPSAREQHSANDLFRELANLESWRDKLNLVQSRCTQVAIPGASKSQKPALNLQGELCAFFADPMRHLPQAPEAWRGLVRVISEHFEMLPKIPTLLDVFYSSLLTFYNRANESALWEHRIEAETCSPRLRDIAEYLQGVGYLHRFVANGPRAESLLWQARQMLVDRPASIVLKHRPNWQDLCAAAEKTISHSREHAPIERDQMMAQLRIASDVDRLASADILRYLDSDVRIVDMAIESVRRIAVARQDEDLEVAIIQKIAHRHGLTNERLQRLFFLAAKRGDHDLAWRAATILHARKVLDDDVATIWNFSGEARQFYPVVIPDLTLLKRCFSDLPSAQKRFAHDTLGIVSQLAGMLQVMDAKSVVTKKLGRSVHPSEDTLERKLLQIDWLPARSKITFEQSQIVLDDLLAIPPFVEVVNRSDWNYVFMRLAEKAGLPAFAWSGERLQSQLTKLVDVNGELRVPGEAGGKLHRFFEELTIETRMALRGFCSAAVKMTPDELAGILLLVIVRVAIIVYPSHYQALRSVMEMRGPLALLRQVEALIISTSYSSLRRMVGTASVVTVPASVYSRRTILKDSD